MSKQKYLTDIKLGEKYRETQTGIEGTAVSLHFYQYGCERCGIELVVNGEVKEYTFDVPRLVHIATNQRAKTPRTGGPREDPPRTGAAR